MKATVRFYNLLSPYIVINGDKGRMMIVDLSRLCLTIYESVGFNI